MSKNFKSVHFHSGERSSRSAIHGTDEHADGVKIVKEKKYVSILRAQHQACYNVTTDRLYLKMLCKFWD
jgi:hypothetical protein